MTLENEEHYVNTVKYLEEVRQDVYEVIDRDDADLSAATDIMRFLEEEIIEYETRTGKPISITTRTPVIFNSREYKDTCGLRDRWKERLAQASDPKKREEWEWHIAEIEKHIHEYEKRTQSND